MGNVLYGRSSMVGAMAWMFGVSLVLTLVLGWVPVAGPFIGPVIGGYIGGYRAGNMSRACLAAILPATLLSLLIVGFGIAAATFSDLPILGAVGVVVAGAVAVILLVHNLLLFITALIGGFVRRIEGS
jgi:hypothetical protein